MGLMVDSGIFIAGERAGKSALEVLQEIEEQFDPEAIEISVITIAELSHGIYRADTPQRKARRIAFRDAIQTSIRVHDLTPEIADIVGRIEADQQAVGKALAFPDLVIAATSILLGFAVLTTNPRHFTPIPGLTVLTP